MRQLISGLAVLGLLVALSVAPVSAGTGSVSIGNGGADGEIGDTFFSVGGGPWRWSGMCDGDVGTIYDIHLEAWVEVRTALEFPIPALPAGATITGATLTLSHAWGNGLDTIAIYGYAGDGTIDAADMVVTGPSVTFPAGTTPIIEDHDVTALLTPGVVAAGWAGFSLRAEPPNFSVGSGHSFECPTMLHFPILTIEYETEDPDEDLDGVPDPDDVCPGTVTDAFPQLTENRYTYDGTGLVSGLAGNPPYTILQTGGCSAMQIIAAMGLGAGHERFGLTRGALEEWIAALL